MFLRMVVCLLKGLQRHFNLLLLLLFLVWILFGVLGVFLSFLVY